MKEKKNNITELVFILDRSGSMAGLESDTIGGFNALLEKQKKQDEPCYVSTILFDNVSEVIHDREKIGEVQPLTEKDYCVRGWGHLAREQGAVCACFRARAPRVRAPPCAVEGAASEWGPLLT